MATNKEVFRTIYDHHIIAKSPNGKLACYEGYVLCPKCIQKKIDKDEFTEIEGTSRDAIAYGYVPIFK